MIHLRLDPLLRGDDKIKPYKIIFIIFVLWRILLFIPLIIAQFFPVNKINHYVFLSYYEKLPPFFSNILVNTWANFDGVHYLNIALNGYTDNLRFFPLYPLLIKSMLFLFGQSSYVAAYIIGFIINHLFLLFGLLILYKLLRLFYNEKISFSTVILLLIFPFSFFFTSIYTESLFLLLTVSTLYLAQKQKWFLTSLVAMLLPITRPIGLIIIPTLITEFFIQYKLNKTKFKKQRLLFLLLLPLGYFFYMIFNYIKTGRFLYFIESQGSLFNGRSVDSIILFPQTLYRYLKILFSVPIHNHDWQIALIEVISFFFAVVMLYILHKKKVRITYLVFSFFGVLIPASTGTFSGLPRYLIVLFPLFLGLALIQNKKIKYLYIIFSVILTIVSLIWFSRGYYVS